jgi:hypothetical protein
MSPGATCPGASPVSPPGRSWSASSCCSKLRCRGCSRSGWTPWHAGPRRRPLTPIGLVRSQLSSSRCTSAAGFALGMPVSCQPATGGTSVTSGCGAKPATYRNFSSACSSATRPLVEPTLGSRIPTAAPTDRHQYVGSRHLCRRSARLFPSAAGACRGGHLNQVVCLLAFRLWPARRCAQGHGLRYRGRGYLRNIHGTRGRGKPRPATPRPRSSPPARPIAAAVVRGPSTPVADCPVTSAGLAWPGRGCRTVPWRRYGPLAGLALRCCSRSAGPDAPVTEIAM